MDEELKNYSWTWDGKTWNSNENWGAPKLLERPKMGLR
jgi:hypothetical protein